MTFVRRLLFVLLAACLLLPVHALTFVQLTDPQFGMGEKGYQEDVASFQRAVVQINALKPDFVVICGDLLHKWTPDAAKEFADCAKGLTMPWYVAPGNHDNPKSAEYPTLFGPDHRVVEVGNVALVVLNTNSWREAAAGEAQLAWLEQTLTQAAAKHEQIIVAGHHPIFVKAADEKETYDNVPLAFRGKILALFAQYRVAAYLTGHLHRNLVAAYHGTTLVSNASTAKNFTPDPLGFRLWRVDADGYLTQEYVAINPAKP